MLPVGRVISTLRIFWPEITGNLASSAVGVAVVVVAWLAPSHITLSIAFSAIGFLHILVGAYVTRSAWRLARMMEARRAEPTPEGEYDA